MIKWNLLAQIVFYYLLATFIVYFLSDYVIFPKVKSSYQDNENNFQTIKLATQDNKKISALYLPNSNATYTILFSHGNAEDIGYLLPWLEIYRNQGYAIFAYDYHGYGTSEGAPSEKNTYFDIEAAYQYLTGQLKISPEKIILHGRSVGTGPTLELALTKPCRAMILESAMTSAFQILTKIPLFPIDKYRNYQKITKIDVPILFIHGTKDEVIPFWQGKKLFELAKTRRKFFYEVSGAGHNDIQMIANDQYWQKIHQFTQSLNNP